LSDLAQVSNGESEHFGQRIYARLVHFMYILAGVTAPVAWIFYGWAFALFFVVGCALAIVNFYWLKRTLEALVDRTVSSPGAKPSSAGVIARLLLRYVLIAVAAYVIFNSSAMSAYGLFAGLCLPVGAIMMEAAYQASRELWRRL
jgi:ATP synthase I subunit